MTHTIHSFLAGALLASAGLVAQSPDVIGLTDTTPLLVRQDLSTCAIRTCNPAVGSAVAAFAGGTAHDARDRGTWVTDGARLAKVDSRNQCRLICPTIPVPNVAAPDYATGLAFNEQTSQLFISYSNNIIHTYQVSGGCGLTLVARCIAPVPTNHIVTGLATDDVNGLLYFASQPLQPSTIAGPIVYSAPQTAPCSPICRYRIPDCGGAGFLQRITGLGFEPCRGILYVTDGPTVVGVRPDPNCMVQFVNCCRLPVNERYVGLCVIPADERPVGRSCTDGGCAACALTMRHVLSGDPAIGNPAFSLDLVSAPANSSAWLLINVGSCSATGPTLGFCGPLLVPGSPVILGPLPTGPGAGCAGTATQPLPLPANPALCGLGLSSQYVGLCFSAAGLGTFVSNCISFVITGS
ncbi:MAG: hypothetical protein IPM29_07710 [Planctomycetes bacterium]|nr:hypothetical protein [Planctomycetota bacterium]